MQFRGRGLLLIFIVRYLWFYLGPFRLKFRFPPEVFPFAPKAVKITPTTASTT